MDRVLDHKVQRQIVGGVAFLLAPTVTFLAMQPLNSVSASYWTDAGTVFVGALCAVAMFLAGYNGIGKARDTEFWLAKLAGFLALVVALFPTSGPALPPRWTQTVASFLFGARPSHLHYGAAILLFSVLTILMGFFSRRASRKGKRLRSIEYAVVCGMMALGLVVAVGATLMDERPDDLVYWIETWTLLWFGVGWFRAGWYHDQDHSNTDPGVIRAEPETGAIDEPASAPVP